MIAVDTNLLVYAHRKDSQWHDRARQLLIDLGEGRSPWAIAWPCVHEFIAIVTHARIYSPPSPLEVAIGQVEAWMESPTVTLLAEGDTYWPALKDMLRDGRISGPTVHDARVASLCILHDVQELWTADRDFNRFPRLRCRNPLIG